MQSSEFVYSIPMNTTLEPYSTRQRLLSLSLSLAMTGSASATVAMANAPAPTFVPAHPVVTPTIHSWSHAASTGATQSSPTTSPVHQAVYHAAGTQQWHPAKTLVQNIAAQATGVDDLNLTSATPLFAAKGLAGFTTVTLDIGGKQQTFSVNSKLTGAELVAAQQVESGGKQEITINAKGAATGGYFDLNSTTLAALDGAIGGNVNSLVVAHGVKAVDTMSNLSLSGSLVNLGSITVGAAKGTTGQTVDTISAANIYNAAGATISSAPASGGLTPTGITLSASGVVSTSGTISSGSVLNVAAPTITNTPVSGGASGSHNTPTMSAAQNVNLETQSLTNAGLISSASGNVNFSNGGGNNNININGTGGTVQAAKGDINFNESGYNGNGNVTINGGNYLSKEVNFNVGTGAINANVDQLTGIVNGTAGSSHITAATDNLDLGTICVSGDPTYYNTKGNITITGVLKGDPDLAIVASGDIIANGGSLDTAGADIGAANGGNILLVAGANFATVPSGGPPGNSTATASNGDTTTTISISNSNTTGGGSKTGGYIDLSGVTLTGNKKNLPIAEINSSGAPGVVGMNNNNGGNAGDVTMIAFNGSAQNSGSVIATSTQGTGGTKIQAVGGIAASGGSNGSDGAVTLMGNGFAIFANSIVGGAITLTGAKPTIDPATPVQIKDGSVIAGAFTPGKFTSTEILTGVMNGSGDLKINNAGLVDLEQTVHALNATINTTGFVEGFYLSTAGAGGVSGGNQNGANGGNIDITAGGIFISFYDAGGGGGAGGSTGNPIGGNGGNAGNITLTATSNNIAAEGYINASGGGGGGGAGANLNVTAANAGGAGGSAGLVKITTPFSFIGDQFNFGYTVLDFKGANGGAGGVGSATAAGGGGGGAPGFGGGGGGGAAGIGGSGNVGGGGGGAFTLLGGGGGGAGTTGATSSATGGGGGSSTGTNNQPSSGGAGGTAIGGGTAGAAGIGGFTVGSKGQLQPNSGAGGAGGGFVTPGTSTGGAAGGQDGGGGGGGIGANAGANGGITSLANGTGGATISVGAASGSSSAPIGVDSATWSITTTKKTDVFISNGGEVSDLILANLATGSTLGLSESHQTLTVGCIITGAAVIDLSSAQGVITNSADPINATSEINISAGISSGLGATGGNINSAAVLTAPTVNLAALNLSGFGGNITAEVNATNISVASISTTGTSKVNLTVDTTAGKTTTFTSGSVGVGGTLTIDATGSGTIASTKGIAGPAVVINSPTANIGTSAKPFLTDVTGTLTVNGSNSGQNFISDSNTGTLTVLGSSASGGSISIVSAAKTLTVGALNYGNVTIQDTSKTTGATVVLGAKATDSIGDGLGDVSITTASAAITMGLGFGVAGTSVSLISTASNVGSTGTALLVSSPVLTLSAAKGLVNVADTDAAILNAGTALNGYTVQAAGLTVDGAINGSNISLTSNAGQPLVVNANIGGTSTQTVTLNSDDGISQNAKAVISGLSVALTDTTVGDIGSGNQFIMIKAANGFTVNGADGSNNYVNENGKGALGNSKATGASFLDLVDKSALTVNDAVTFGTVNITAPSLSLITTNGGTPTSGSISATFLDVVAPVVSVGTGTKITVTTASTFTSTGSLSISGSGAITPGTSLFLGEPATKGGKAVTSITLGDAKTGANDPFQTIFAGNSTISNLTIDTSGKFTSSLDGTNSITLNGGGTPGTFNINVSSFALSGTSTNPIFLNTGNTNTQAGGTINLTLTGTSPITLGGASPLTVASAQSDFILGANGDAGGVATGSGGTINVTTNGNLVVHSSGIGLATSAGVGKDGSLTLSGAKGLAVVDDILSGLTSPLGNEYDNVLLTSGSKNPFVVGGGTSVVNGTDGLIVANNNVTVNAAGTVTTNAANSISSTNITLSNSFGTLTAIGKTTGDITVTNDLSLSGKTGITLGDAKTGAGSPIDGLFGPSPAILDLTINTAGNFTSDITNFVLNSTQSSGGTLRITASNIVTLNNPTNSPIVLKADGQTNGGNIILTLTGTQAVNFVTGSATKTPNYQLENLGSTANSGKVTINTVGALTIGDGLNASNGEDTLSLSGGKGLAISNSDVTGKVSNLILSSGATAPLVIGAASAPQGSNSIVGPIQAAEITISAPAITVNAGITATGTGGSGNVELDTKLLANNSAIAGTNSLNFGGTMPLASLTIVNATGASGTYAGFSSMSVNATGAVNIGNMLTTGNTLAGSLTNLAITTGGVLTVDPAIPTLTLASNSTVNIQAASFATKATGPIVIDAAGTANVTIQTAKALTIGTANGALNLGIDSNCNQLTVTSTGGALTILQSLDAATTTVSGSSLSVQNVSVTGGTGGLNAYATGSSGTITTSTGGALVSTGTLTIASANNKLSSTSAAINAATVDLGTSTLKGALNLINQDASPTTLTGASPISALNYIETGASLVVNSISTTNGGISITGTNTSPSSVIQTNTSAPATLQTVGGGITLQVATGSLELGKNSVLQTSSGSVTLQGLSGAAIQFDGGVNIHASGTAKGVGQVNIIIGNKVPTTGLIASPTPSTVAPTVITSDGATVTYGVSGATNQTVSTNASNVLNADGRNIVFNNADATSTITLLGSNTIIADPPAGAMSAGSPAIGVSAANVLIQTAGLSSLPNALSGSTPVSTNSFAPAPISSDFAASNAAALSNMASISNGQSMTANQTQPTGLYSSGVSGGANSIGIYSTGINTGNNMPAANPGQAASFSGGSVLNSTLETVTSGAPLNSQSARTKPSLPTVLQGKVSNISQRNLSRGAMLLAPQTNTTVNTDSGKVFVAADAVALIVAFDGGVAVYNFHDKKHDSVVIEGIGHKLSVSPGRNAVLTNRNIHYFEEVNPAEFVGYRKLAANSYDDGVTTFQSEFYMPSMVHGVEPLKQLFHAKDAESKKIAKSMLKTAAILSTIGDNTPFEHMVATRMTAMNTTGKSAHN